jgi:hypothetical protein
MEAGADDQGEDQARKHVIHGKKMDAYQAM